jgi:hypothetical protein
VDSIFHGSAAKERQRRTHRPIAMSRCGAAATEFDEDLRQPSAGDSASNGGHVAGLFAIGIDAIEQPAHAWVEEEDRADGLFHEFRPIVAPRDVR